MVVLMCEGEGTRNNLLKPGRVAAQEGCLQRGAPGSKFLLHKSSFQFVATIEIHHLSHAQ